MNNLTISPRLINKNRLSIIIIAVFHLVGLIGFIIPSLTVFFLSLVPWHLLLMAGVIIYSHNTVDTRFLLFASLIFISGLAAEITGVHTGYLFGSYSYGETLGLKLLNVPLMIAVNWFLLIYSTGVLMQRARVKNIYVRLIIGALALVMLDIIIEPVAIHFNYWHWAGNTIPVKNYICWFLLSAAMLFIFELFKFKQQSKVAPALLAMQFIFFLVLSSIN